MPSLNWLDITVLNFNVLFLLESFHVQSISQRQPDKNMGTALNAHLDVQWYLKQIYPPIEIFIAECLSLADKSPTPAQLRTAEIAVLNSMQDWLIYILDPKKYDRLDFLKWDNSSLLEMADFTDKIVLDIGAGTGRLAFAVAALARCVFAIEPVARLRRFIWEKSQDMGFQNVYPLDGFITQIPFPNHFADILMAGHVFGDDPQKEYQEMVRVVKDGGMILLHPGTNAGSEEGAHQFLVSRDFNFGFFTEPEDGVKRKYWKFIEKTNESMEEIC